MLKRLFVLVLLLGFAMPMVSEGATLYVDAANGSDVLPSVNPSAGTISQPFKSLSFAYNWVAVEHDVIILLPGVYGALTAQGQSGDAWPLSVTWKDVIIQGTSALNTVLDGRLNPSGSSTATSIFDFNPNSKSENFINFLIDSVTIMNAQTGILARDIQEVESAAWVTVANCFIVNNVYGIHMHAHYYSGMPNNPNDWDKNNFIEHRLRIVNDTIANNLVGILDDSTRGAHPIKTIHGESDPAIQNCIIYQNALSDLEGIDGWDVRNVAFATFDQAGLSTRRPSRPNPIPTVSLLGVPLASLYLRPHNPNGVNVNGIDYRQYPAALTIDQGTISLTALTNLTWINQFFTSNCGFTADIWDADCEGYGNTYPANYTIDPMDIGADQLGELIITGYNPQTTNFSTNKTIHLRVTLPKTWPVLSYIWLFGNQIPSSSWGFVHGYMNWMIPPVPGMQSQGSSFIFDPILGILYLATVTPGFPFQLFFTGTPPVYAPVAFTSPPTTNPLRTDLQSIHVDVQTPNYKYSNLQTYNNVQ